MESLRERYGHKICTIDELIALVGRLPRTEKVVMCHGTFDVVHPGHLRHLLYAKTKGQLLVASLTADQHIQKGEMRPHVPQDLRAANLAAYEMVDYVLIDLNPTPLENLRRLQPDAFVKGYEYTSGEMHPKTRDEYEVVTSYGGEMIFSPGDFVLSSSKLISLAPPDLKHEKLVSVMERHNISFSDLRATVKSMSGLKVNVLGDTIVDSYTRCSMIGGQTKTPTISVLYERVEHFVGGAGIVAKHLRAAGANVTFQTLLGSDELGSFALRDLESAGVDVEAQVDASRPTTDKNSIVVDDYRLLKVDRLDNRPIGEDLVARFSAGCAASNADLQVFSDFRHGIFHQGSITRLVNSIPAGRFRVADSQVASRWGNIADFQHFDLITPNEREARFSLGDQDSNVRSLASKLYEVAKCKVLMLKLGARGVMTYTQANPTDLSGWFHLDALTESVIDLVGAGDAMLAYAGLALKSSGSPAQAAIVGSVAAAMECEFDGNVPIVSVDVIDRLSRLEREVNFTA